MERMFKSGHGTPKNMQTDTGTEFFNSKFKALMKSYRINHYSTFSTLIPSIVERFNTTLNGKYKWVV